METPIPTPLASDADPTSVVPIAVRAIEAIERKDYAIAAGLVLMIVTFVATRIAVVRAFIPKDYVATVLLGVSAVGGFGAALATGVSPGRAAFAFLLCSASAVAFWEGVAKHVVRIVSSRSRI